MRLIDADELKRKWHVDVSQMKESAFILATMGALYDLEAQPTVDPYKHGRKVGYSAEEDY